MALQRSVKVAVRRASPLPEPPTEAIFEPVIEFEFIVER
jgi:hypothetical protein